jgi:NADH:ubiquinone oxidoreductase subunit C
VIDQVKAIDGVTMITDSDYAESGCHFCLSVSSSSMIEIAKCYRKSRYILEMLTCIDLRSSGEGLRLVYQFLDPEFKERHRLYYDLAENELAPSITRYFESGNWYEAEVFDMFGVQFKGHPDLRRLLTGSTTEGFPLLKDFSVTEGDEVGEDD